MELSLERPGDHLFVRSVDEEGIRIGERSYRSSLIVSADRLVENWPVTGFASLERSLLGPIFELRPEVVLLGTGPRQEFPEPELLMEFYRRGIGVEVMATPAACRTFNVLVSERRNVVAALLPMAAGG